MLSRYFLIWGFTSLIFHQAQGSNVIRVRKDLCADPEMTVQQCLDQVTPKSVIAKKAQRLGSSAGVNQSSTPEEGEDLQLPVYNCEKNMKFSPNQKISDLPGFSRVDVIAYQIGQFCCKHSKINGEICDRVQHLNSGKTLPVKKDQPQVPIKVQK